MGEWGGVGWRGVKLRILVHLPRGLHTKSWPHAMPRNLLKVFGGGWWVGGSRVSLVFTFRPKPQLKFGPSWTIPTSTTTLIQISCLTWTWPSSIPACHLYLYIKSHLYFFQIIYPLPSTHGDGGSWIKKHSFSSIPCSGPLLCCVCVLILGRINFLPPVTNTE